MHALRIGHEGLELIQTGTITLPVAEPMRGRLREVRAGAPPLADVLDEIDAAAAELRAKSASQDLPAEDRGAIDTFLSAAYRQAWG